MSGEGWIPAHPAEYDPGGGIVPAIGCSRLRCPVCEVPVRVFADAHLPPQHETDLAALYVADDPHAFAEVRRLEWIRSNLYVCPCSAHGERGEQTVESWDDLRPLRLPWQCAGHPEFRFPGSLDGLQLALDSIGEVVGDLLAARVPNELHPSHAELAGFQAVRVYDLLPSAAHREDFAGHVEPRLTDDDVHVRRGALGFYRLRPRAEGAATVLALRRKRKLWEATDPVRPRVTLRHTLDLAVAAVSRTQG